jgi:hypothetical protein
MFEQMPVSKSIVSKYRVRVMAGLVGVHARERAGCPSRLRPKIAMPPRYVGDTGCETKRDNLLRNLDLDAYARREIFPESPKERPNLFR